LKKLPICSKALSERFPEAEQHISVRDLYSCLIIDLLAYADLEHFHVTNVSIIYINRLIGYT
jgi:hypothetical protein